MEVQDGQVGSDILGSAVHEGMTGWIAGVTNPMCQLPPSGNIQTVKTESVS